MNKRAVLECKVQSYTISYSVGAMYFNLELIM